MNIFISTAIISAPREKMLFVPKNPHIFKRTNFCVDVDVTPEIIFKLMKFRTIDIFSLVTPMLIKDVDLDNGNMRVSLHGHLLNFSKNTISHLSAWGWQFNPEAYEVYALDD